ncbi:hypothetical protein F5882DRAFT_308772 [Hyaloscypha sp. PMI_1271]|nr:hypothetical protein F5882DRAFT_308772 [Hyaloscypha sp. PMI_1271]
MFKTTMSNRSSLEEPGSLTKVIGELLRIIQDSITLGTALGERYLWCIEQNNESQKYVQISQIEGIYSQATATIVALSGLNAGSALSRMQRNNLLHLSSPGSVYELGARVGGRTPSLLQYVSRLHHESRAWTFQEKLLSKRCLVFTDLATYFYFSECLVPHT